MSKSEKFDLYQLVTDKIVAQLEQGTAAWHRPWGVSNARPTNYATKKPYQGINILLLGSAGYSSPYWMSYRQAQKKGGHVREGEQGTIVVFWKLFDVDVRKEVKGVTTTVKEKRPFLRYSRVFNAEQIEGIDFPQPEKREFAALDDAEHLIEDYEVSIHYGGDRAYYSPLTDKIGLPTREQFETPEDFYSTAFHEMVHSTGHESRLNRPGVAKFDSFGSEQYGKEELVAEMGAAFLSAEFGIERVEPNAAYLQNWLNAIKGDKKLVVLAGFQSAKAVRYILGDNDNEENTDALDG